jgi:hypothetical protein
MDPGHEVRVHAFEVLFDLVVDFLAVDDEGIDLCAEYVAYDAANRFTILLPTRIVINSLCGCERSL